MDPERNTNPSPQLYAELVSRLNENGGILVLNSEDALAFWITALQRVAAEVEFGTNSDPIAEAPKLVVLGFSEVDLLKDDPRNLLDETWSPIELHSQ